MTMARAGEKEVMTTTNREQYKYQEVFEKFTPRIQFPSKKKGYTHVCISSNLSSAKCLNLDFSALKPTFQGLLYLPPVTSTSSSHILDIMFNKEQGHMIEGSLNRNFRQYGELKSR